MVRKLKMGVRVLIITKDLEAKHSKKGCYPISLKYDQIILHHYIKYIPIIGNYYLRYG